eukprot:116479_1
MDRMIGSYKWRRWVVAVIVRQWIHPCTGQILFVYGIRGRRGMEALDVAGPNGERIDSVWMVKRVGFDGFHRDFNGNWMLGLKLNSMQYHTANQATKTVQRASRTG